MLESLRFTPIDDLGARAAQEPSCRRVGVWDLEVDAGFLPALLGRLNEVQHAFIFEMIYASVPRAISKGGEWTLAWARERIGEAGVAADAEDLRHSVVAHRLQPIAVRAKQKFDLDIVVLLTPDLIAFEEKRKVMSGYFSWSDGTGVIIVSAHDVRDFAKCAGRKFEVALAAMILAQVLVEFSYDNPEIGFHEENRGCLFDFNDTRVTLIDTIRAMCLEPECLAKLDETYRSAAAAIVLALRSED